MSEERTSTRRSVLTGGLAAVAAGPLLAKAAIAQDLNSAFEVDAVMPVDPEGNDSQDLIALVNESLMESSVNESTVILSKHGDGETIPAYAAASGPNTIRLMPAEALVTGVLYSATFTSGIRTTEGASLQSESAVFTFTPDFVLR